MIDEHILSTGAIFPGGAFQDCIKLFGEWLLEWATQNGAFGVNEGGVVTRKAGSAVDEVCKSGPGLYLCSVGGYTCLLHLRARPVMVSYDVICLPFITMRLFYLWLRCSFTGLSSPFRHVPFLQ